jgi:hypothetical protein
MGHCAHCIHDPVTTINALGWAHLVMQAAPRILLSFSIGSPMLLSAPTRTWHLSAWLMARL